MSPGVVVPERVRIRHDPRVVELGTAHGVVGRIREGLARVGEHVGVLRAHEAVEPPIGQQQLAHLPLQASAGEPRLLRPLAAQSVVERLVRVDPFGFRIQLAQTEHELALRARGDARALAAVGLGAPDVVLVVDQHRLVVLQPSGHAVPGLLLDRVVVLPVDEVRGGRRRSGTPPSRSPGPTCAPGHPSNR